MTKKPWNLKFQSLLLGSVTWHFSSLTFYFNSFLCLNKSYICSLIFMFQCKNYYDLHFLFFPFSFLHFHVFCTLRLQCTWHTKVLPLKYKNALKENLECVHLNYTNFSIWNILNCNTYTLNESQNQIYVMLWRIDVFVESTCNWGLKRQIIFFASIP